MAEELRHKVRWHAPGRQPRQHRAGLDDDVVDGRVDPAERGHCDGVLCLPVRERPPPTLAGVVDPPPLPPRLARMSAVLAVGTALWLVGAAALLVAWLVGGCPLGIWFTTCLAGAVLGGLGYGVFSWQRAAARRGSRTAQQGLE